MAQPTGVYFQYRADNAVATYSTATTTGGIADSSGNARPNAIPGTAAIRPTLNTGGLNGHSYLTFDGVDDRLTTTNSPDPSLLSFSNGKAGLTVAHVVRLTGSVTAAGTRFLHFHTRGSSTAGRITIFVTAAGFWGAGCRRLDTDANTDAISTVQADNNPHLVVAVADYSGTGTIRVYLDGVQIASANLPSAVGPSSATNSQAWSYGASATPDGWTPMEWYDGLGYDRALTSTELTALWEFERDRYALGPAPASKTLRVLRAGVGTSGAATLRVLRAGVTTETSVLANAGAPTTVGSLDTVVLSAEASSGNPTGYTWTQTSGPAVTLRPNGNVPRPEFTAPATDAGITLTFSLAVTSGGTTSANTATATVTVRPHIEWLWGGAAWTPELTEVIRPV